MERAPRNSPPGWTAPRTPSPPPWTALSAAVADLKTQLAQLLRKEQEKDVPPRRWAARATAKDWDQLDRPGSTSSTPSYSLLGDYTIPPCWPAHPGVVEELAGLHHAWTIAVINDELGKRPAATTSPPGTTGGYGPACAA